VQAVAAHLKAEGYRIDSALATNERGIDIVAVIPGTKRQLLVEARGGTSSKPGTANFGNPFSSNQAKTHVSVAFYFAAMLRQEHSSEGAQVALAFPSDQTHRALINGIRSALNTLSISVFFVDADRRVTAFPSDPTAQTGNPPAAPQAARR